MSFTAAELEAWIPRLRRYAHALAREPLRADDLLQDALLLAWSRRRQWRPGSDLRAWLFAILHHVFVDEWRRGVVHARRDGRVGGPSDDDAGDDPLASLPDERAWPPGALLDIERGLASLPLEQRAVVLLVGLEELSYREAADVVGVPVGTIMSRLSRGRERLRAAMDGTTAAADAPTFPALKVVR